MRPRFTTVLLLSLLALGHGWAEEKAVPASSGPTFALPPASSQSSVSLFNEAQITFVQNWIWAKAPECPANLTTVVAQHFLAELQAEHPEKLDRLLFADFPASEFESALLRHVGAQLTAPAQSALREAVALRRIRLMLAGEKNTPTPAAAALLAKIQDASPSQSRRLLEGRLEDDDLVLLLKKVRQSGMTQKEPAPLKPKLLNAADIVAEFSRHNQAGSALQRLQAYTVEGKLKTATGEEQELLLFKLRPNRFRLVVRSAGLTRLILASDGSRFWQQSPGQPPQVVPAQEMGSRIYLAEFADPLFGGESYTFERREDGTVGGRKFHRIAVHRPDASEYVACIDTETFREIARENPDRSVARYTDFHEIGGVTYAFREEVADQAGRTGQFTITRLTPNPGLIQDLFELPSAQNVNYFKIEQLLASAAPTGKEKP